jgi:hypothetical protein
MSATYTENIRVFISYSHDSPEHMDMVLGLSDRLRDHGIDCLIDQYEISPSEGWPRWTMKQVEDSRFVLIVCTEPYYRRVRGTEETGKGLGAKWEGAIITQELYDSEANNNKFIPLLFSANDLPYIPVHLRGATRYILDEDYEELYRHLTNQPKRVKPALGKHRAMPPLDRREDFVLVTKNHSSSSTSDAGNKSTQHKPSSKSSAAKKKTAPSLTDSPDPESQQPRSRWLASWIFGTLLLLFFLYVFLFSPDRLPDYKQRILAFISALLAGLFGYFLTGDIGLELNSTSAQSGSLKVKATAGLALFVLMLVWWLSPFAPVKPDENKPLDPIPESANYQVRVTVLDLQQVPVNDADIQTSVSDEVKKVAGGWEITFPVASKPAGNKITIYAAKPGDSLYGQEDLVLDKPLYYSVKIYLRKGAPPTIPVKQGGTPVLKPGPSSSVTIYRVRITVLDPDNDLVEEAEISSLPGGEVKKVARGWEIDIPAANKPANGNLTIYAAKPGAFSKGQASLRLDADPNPTVEIHLKRDTSARIKGNVIDSSSQAVVAATVNVAGHTGEQVQTNAGGEFDLPAHAASGQLVQLEIRKAGYTPERQNCYAGRSCTILLRKETP